MTHLTVVVIVIDRVFSYGLGSKVVVLEICFEVVSKPCIVSEAISVGVRSKGLLGITLRFGKPTIEVAVTVVVVVAAAATLVPSVSSRITITSSTAVPKPRVGPIGSRR